MISLASPSYDPNGYIRLDARPRNLYEGERRGSVTATLDGEVSVYDAGFSEADLTLKVALPNPTRATLVTLRYLIAYYSELVLCCEIGVYACRVSTTHDRAELSLSLRLLRRLDR